jgi:hypothetical protein
MRVLPLFLVTEWLGDATGNSPAEVTVTGAKSWGPE